MTLAMCKQSFQIKFILFFAVPQNGSSFSSEGHLYKGGIHRGQWVDAANLQSGDRLLDSNNKWQEILSITIKPEPLQVYNLTVDQTHTYFIKGLEKTTGVWVHNTCSVSVNDIRNMMTGT